MVTYATGGISGKGDAHQAKRIYSDMLAAAPAHPAEGAPALADVDLPDVEDMAHSAVQEALSHGVSHDVIHRWMRAVMEKTVVALAATPAAPAEPAAAPDARHAEVLMGYMHPGNFDPQQNARWERGAPCVLRKNGWKGYENQVPVYARKSDVDAAIAAQAAAKGAA